MKHGVPLLAFVALVLTSRPAHAQTKDDVARADALFHAAKALTDAGDYQDACAKFAESKRLAPGLGVTLYLADCYERTGRTASAWTEFRSAEGQARQRNDKRADVARGRAQTLEAKLNRVIITVAPSVPLSGLQVLRDGLPVEREELGVAVPVDPGDHTVVVSAPGHVARTFNARVGPEGQTATISVDSLGPSTTPEATATATPPPPAPVPVSPSGGPPSPGPAGPPSASSPEAAAAAPEDPGKTRKFIGLGVGAAGVVGIVVGSVFGVIAENKLTQSNSSHCDMTNHCDATGLGLRKDAGNAATLSTIAFAAGGVLLAGGVVLFITAPRAPSGSAIVVAPALLAGGGGALVRASF
jgi:hypothetical protein